MAADAAMRSFADDELKAARASMEKLEADLQKALLPRDPNDERNIFLEIRAGAGADHEEDIALVVRVPGQQRLLQIGLELLHARARRLELVVGERPHRGVGGHLPGGLGIALRLAEALVERDDASQL